MMLLLARMRMKMNRVFKTLMIVCSTCLLVWALLPNMPIPQNAASESLGDFNNRSATSDHTIGREIRILWYNRPKWFITIHELNRGIQSFCKTKQCEFTEDNTHAANHSAIIFSVEAPVENLPKVLPSPRNPDQPWMFFHAEPATKLLDRASLYQSKQWLNAMNWSITYREDSDVYFPFSEYIPTKVKLKNYSAIFRKKDRFAAWFVSNCHTQSKREQYVKQLQSFGIPVDIFGSCSGRKLLRSGSAVNDMLERHYKFYLSFENSMCKDYITEKLYNYYHKDVVLVVRGGADYSKKFKNGTYINTSDFPTTKGLAKYLLRLNSSESLYNEYLERKNAYPFRLRDHSKQLVYNSCFICQKVKDAYKYRKQYVDINQYMFKNRCNDPIDV